MLPCWPHLRREEASPDRRLTKPHCRVVRALKSQCSECRYVPPGWWSHSQSHWPAGDPQESAFVAVLISIFISIVPVDPRCWQLMRK